MGCSRLKNAAGSAGMNWQRQLARAGNKTETDSSVEKALEAR